MKYCWLNIETGEFSNSWDHVSHDELGVDLVERIINHHKSDCWKLIKFECLTDEKFEFTIHMKLR